MVRRGGAGAGEEAGRRSVDLGFERTRRREEAGIDVSRGGSYFPVHQLTRGAEHGQCAMPMFVPVAHMFVSRHA